MWLTLQIAAGVSLGLLIALIVVDYFEEIILTLLISLGLGLLLIWIISILEGNTHLLQKFVSVLKPLFST